MLQRMTSMKNRMCTCIRSHTYTSLGYASLWSAVGKKLFKPPAPRKRLTSETDLCQAMLELAKGFEPLTL